jgi:hypothetical protein
MDLEHCLAPMRLTEFQETYWERQPLEIHRTDANYYDNLFSLNDIDSYLQIARSDPDPTSILIANQKSQPSKDKLLGPSGLVETSLLMKAYTQGDTIVLNFMHRFWRPLTELCRKWEMFFRHPVAVHAYLTPAGSQAYEPHFDAYDIFVLQLHGSKKWKLYPALIDSPLPSQARTVDCQQTGELFREVLLEAGDLLYFPRGWVHEVLTSEKPSLHLSVSVRPYRLVDLVTAAVEAAAFGNPVLRQPLKTGLLASDCEWDHKNEIQDLMLQIDWQSGLRRLEQRFLSQQESLPNAQFASLENQTITADTRLSRHPNMLCSAELQPERATLFFTRNFLRGPANLFPALDFIARNESFVVRELPGNLNIESKLVLVRRLVQEGLLSPIKETEHR